MRALAVAILLSILPIHPLGAQWHVGLEVGTVQYRGTSRDTSGSVSGAYLRPDHATTYGIRIGREIGRGVVGLRASLGTPGIAAVDGRGDLTFTDRTTGRLIELVPLFGWRVARVGAGGAFRVEGGPAIDLWDIDGEMRARLAALGAVVFEWPVAGRFTGAIRAEGTLGASVFDAAELPPELERRPTWRYGVTLGLRYRL